MPKSFDHTSVNQLAANVCEKFEAAWHSDSQPGVSHSVIRDETAAFSYDEQCGRSLEWMCSCDKFSVLPGQEFFELSNAMESVSFLAGDRVLAQGEVGQDLYVLVSGVVEVVIQTSAGKHHLAECKEGEVIGGMSILTGKPCTADVLCQTDVTAYRIGRKSILGLRERSAVFRQCLSNAIGDRLGGGDLAALSGQVVNHYEVQRPLGRGGMSVVYLAEDTDTGEPVALKMLSHYLVERRGARGLFQHEAEITQRMSHPHLIKAHECFIEFSSLFIALELCEGGTLSDLIRQQQNARFEISDMKSIMSQIASGLLHLHEADIVHRDIKPSNIMVERDGTVKVADFGLADMLSIDASSRHQAI